MSSCYFFCMAELADTSWRYFYGGTRRTWLNVLGSAIHNFVTTTLHLNKRIPDFHSITGCPIIIAWIEYTRSMGQVPLCSSEREGGMGRENERQYDASATFCPNLLLSPILCWIHDDFSLNFVILCRVNACICDIS